MVRGGGGGAKQALFGDDDDDGGGGGGGGGGFGGGGFGGGGFGSNAPARRAPTKHANHPPPERGLLKDDDDAAAVLGFNPEFARRFEHNKRREELHRLKERNPRLAARLEREAAREALGGGRAKAAAAAAEDDDDDDDDESTSSSDDDDDLEELAQRDDTDRVLEVLTRLKRKDPSIKQPEVRFFDDDDDDADVEGEEDGEGDGQKKAKKTKPVYLRQVLAEQALAGAEQEEEEEAGGRGRNGQTPASRIPVYDAEQQQAKAEFLRAAASAEGGGDDAFGLVPRGRKQQQQQQAAATDGGDDKNARVQKLLSDYFGADDDKLDPDERFLKRYLAERKWLQEDDDDDDDDDDGDDNKADANANADDNDNDAAALEEDERFLERADEFEHSYNFRFEQPGSHQIVGHPRQIEDAVRKKDDKRARKRKEKAERKEAERKEAEEEVKRLKNLKKIEIQDRLRAVQEVAGVGAPDVHMVDALLEGDFDPDAFDRHMERAFGSDYYDQGENEGDGDDDADAADAVLKDARAAQLLRQAGAIDDDEDEVPMPIGARAKTSKQEPIDAARQAEARAEVSRLMDDYYRLDYEGTAGGLKTRFKYRSVEPGTGGLTMEELLCMDDRTLNSIVPIKHLAPFREGKVRPNYKALQAAREARQATGGKGRASRRRPGGGGVDGMRLEREGHAPADNKAWQAKWKKPAEQPPPQDKQAARAASFAPLTMGAQKRARGDDAGGGGGKKAKKGDAVAAPPTPASPSLTKAQRKNLKRSLKRAAERTGGALTE